jgi:TonB family protein
MNRANMKERGISILVSVLFHVAVLFLLIKLVPPVRIYLYRQVANVRIVEPRTMYLSRITGLFETQTSGSPSPQMSSEDLSVRGTEDWQQIEPDPGVVYLKNLNIGRDVEQTTESFDLIPSPKSEGSFSLGIGQKKPEYEVRVEEDTRKDLDFSKYNTPALSSLRFNRIMTKKGGGVPSGQIDPGVSDQLEGYDITPWVKQVVDKIRNNWTLPPIDESIALGEVKILIIIGKSGNIVAMEIVESSDFQVFDQTTTAAIRSSTPFPPLPVNFPSERLEAFLVFEFHE